MLRPLGVKYFAVVILIAEPSLTPCSGNYKTEKIKIQKNNSIDNVERGIIYGEENYGETIEGVRQLSLQGGKQ